ncbi:hypothetical protein [Tessaracoccus sp. Z1128]
MTHTERDDEVYDPEVYPSQDILHPDPSPGHTVLDPDVGAVTHHPTAAELTGDALGQVPNAESETRFG